MSGVLQSLDREQAKELSVKYALSNCKREKAKLKCPSYEYAVVLHLPCHSLAMWSLDSGSMMRADGTANMIQETDMIVITILRLGRRTSHGADTAMIIVMDRHITTSKWIYCMVMNVAIGAIHFLGRERYSDRLLVEERRRRLALCSSCRHGLSLLLWLVARSHGARSHIIC